MVNLSPEDSKLLEKMVKDISKESLETNWSRFMEITPIHSGSQEEEEAAQFIRQRLEEAGLSPEILRYDGYISDPKYARLQITFPHQIEFQTTPYRQVGSTGPEGLDGEIIYLGPDEIGKMDCRDKIVLAEHKTAGDWMGVRYPLTLKLQQMGIKGLILIEQDTMVPTIIHQRADFSVSGSPTSDNIHRVQTIPAILSVSNKDGQYLKTMVAGGEVRAHIVSIVETGWKRLPLPVVEIKGTVEPDKFMLVNGHVDTPPFSPGVTDNASGVVSMLELARVLHKNRAKLRRSVRIAFWTAHEIGRYGGSVWYNDNFWRDLRYNCVAFLNIDSPGAKGATGYKPAPISEVADLYKEVIKAAAGLDVEATLWPTRAGDCSFWGTGLPHASATSALPKELYDPFVNYSGGGWWWHTAWATLDRGDVNVLARDVGVNLHYIFRMVNCRILPMNFTTYAQGMIKTLENLQDKADKVRGYFNLYSLIDLVKEFEQLSQTLEEALTKAWAKKPSDEAVADINHCLMWISRHVNPVAHSDAGKTDQMDMATFGATPFPRINQILELTDMSLHQSPQFKFLRTKLVREKNYVEDGFYQALGLIRETLAKHQDLFT